MDFTSRMVALLGELRRERNGAVADAMTCYGKPYGLNYGVSLPTLRSLARAEIPDHDFARYLYRQDVRELRLAALHIAEPARLTEPESSDWAAGIVNTEIAEEAAFALLSRAGVFPRLFEKWIADPEPLLQYAALLAAARTPHLTPDWICPAVEAVRRCAADAAACDAAASKAAAVFDLPAADATTQLSAPDSGSFLPAAVAAQFIARGAVAMLAACGALNEENRQAVIRAAGSLGKLPAEDYVHEELAWRLEA